MKTNGLAGRIAAWAIVITFVMGTVSCGSDSAKTTPVSYEQPPIMVVIDMHCDPLGGTVDQQLAGYLAWSDAMGWMLDQADLFGAKVSFLSDGSFMEWVLEDPAKGNPLIQRLYASGDLVGTHSHTSLRGAAPHEWQDAGYSPTPEQIITSWDDHAGIVNQVITQALGITDPAGIQAVNSARGAHIPDAAALRIQMMADYGFTIHQPGPEEDFYIYFKHYVMNPYRPAGWWFLSEDPFGPVVDVPTGSILGLQQEHKGIMQDNRMPAKQARFILELLNWLHDVHVAGTGRVWTFGWGSHCHEYMPGSPTRDSLVPMLDWLSENFVGQQAGGSTAAAYASYVDARDAFYAWEKAYPGASSFNYPASSADWTRYPYLEPAARYLTEATYLDAMPAIGTVRWHSLEASLDIGGPYAMYVLYTADGSSVTVDLSGYLGAGNFALVDPALGTDTVFDSSAVTVPVTGAILVPVDKVLVF